MKIKYHYDENTINVLRVGMRMWVKFEITWRARIMLRDLLWDKPFFFLHFFSHILAHTQCFLSSHVSLVFFLFLKLSSLELSRLYYLFFCNNNIKFCCYHLSLMAIKLCTTNPSLICLYKFKFFHLQFMNLNVWMYIRWL